MEDFIWTDAQIQWMTDASKKSKYYYWIADKISAYLPPQARIFNAGGGLGDLAIWLSYHVEQVSVIENDPKAVAAFRARCPHNVIAMMGDVLTYTPDRLYDALVLYGIGEVEQVLTLAREISRSKTFVILPQNGDADAATLTGLQDTLKGTGIPFTYESFEQEQVQPFRSRTDAAAYFIHNWNREVSADELDGLLTETADTEFPYSYSVLQKLALVVFDAANPALKKLLS